MTRRKFFKVSAAAAVLSTAAVGGIGAFLRQEQFGAFPEGEGMRRILASPHYTDGVFHNLVPGPVLSNNGSFTAALFRSFFTKKDNPIPPGPVPTRGTHPDLPERARDIVIWLGHSSFLVQIGGSRLLIDPVFSSYAAPVSFSTRAFAGSTPYAIRDMPDIDCLLISHDHWDHLDYRTVMGLKDKIKSIVCGLGVGAHFRRWGFPDRIIHEADWGERTDLNAGLRVHITTARHYSGRALTRNKTLWAGFLLETPHRRIFFSGDSGYGPHFAEIGKRFGSVDLALLDCGQYNERWRYIHMTPEEAVQAAEDVRAKNVLPAHVGKFSLAYHAWDEPFKRIAAAGHGKRCHLLTPVIGEPVELMEPMPTYAHWWKSLASHGDI